MGTKRRERGEGTVYQRTSDGMWMAKIVPPGSTKTKYFSSKTEQGVRKKLREFKKETSRNGYANIQKITVREYMDNWFREVKMNSLKPKSLDALDSTLRHQIYPYIGDIQIAALTPDDVQSMINQLVAKGLAYSTIKKAYDAINPCFKLGIIKGNVLKNPCVGVVLPKMIKRKSSDIRFFTQDEVERICQECVTQHSNGKQIYRLGQSIILLMYTGMRIGELLGLKWNDIDFEKKIARIEASVVVVKDRDNDRDDTAPKYKLLEQSSTKTDSSERFIYLNQKAITALKDLHAINGDFDYVMSNSKGKILIPKNFDRMLRNVLLRCGLEPSGAHVLRHTYASMLFKNGVDVKTVSELLGHKDVSVTYNIYIHLIKEQKHEAVEILDNL